jgi:hypothetical protein
MNRDIFIKNRQAFCNFCNEPCNKGGVSSAHMDESLNLSMYRWWHCDKCHVSFLVYQDLVNELELRTSLNNRFYVVKVYFDLGRTEIFNWKDDKPELAGDRLIIKLPAILDVTPKTLVHKLQTILTFL